MASRGKRPFSIMVLGSDEESILKFLDAFDKEEKISGTRRMSSNSVTRVVSSDDGVAFRLVYKTAVSQNLNTTATLPPNMFKGAKNRDTVILFVFDTSSKLSTEGTVELIPKAMEQACYIWTQKYKERFRSEAMISSDGPIQRRPPLQILVVGIGKDLETNSLRSELKKRCADTHLPISPEDERDTKEALNLLHRINCVTVEMSDRKKVQTVVAGEFQKLYDTKIAIQCDGTCGDSVALANGGSCCVIS